ncbi:TlpA family protein disulfide reductase [Nocardioides marmoribigeumensis]|uniref:Thiol-disulfide isomerase/thioredoxin n=1 Tax=Nocardioides marmoribigeumensis TaxID=433649 RepID=A0ABU2BTS7_9ACTN|nr:thioredoxin family protein [Nocardioides marmoribigeumensis]MDR7362034.1 thiol-disulfide isomerase/thioredoxin [Nocardioides marmoribigeumensis]
MSPGAWVVLAVLVVASAFGLWRARTDGRFRGTAAEAASDGAWSGDSTPLREEPGAPAPEADDASVRTMVGEHHEFGHRATLLQFSSAFCAPCRATRRVLADIAEIVPGVSHVEIDAEEHLETVRRLEVHRTPTTLVLDAHGREVSRAVGAPRKEQVLAALAPVLD